MSACSRTSRTSTVTTDHWLSLVPEGRTRPGVALALESLVKTSPQPRCAPVAVASVRRSAKPWPGQMGPPKPGGHPREDWGGPRARGPVSEAKAAGPPRGFAARPGRGVTQAPRASGLRRLPPRFLVARGDAPAGSGRSSLALGGLGASAPRGSGSHEPQRLLGTQAPAPDQRRRLRRLVTRARGTVPARGPRAGGGPSRCLGRLSKAESAPGVEAPGVHLPSGMRG